MSNKCRHCGNFLTFEEEGLCNDCRESKCMGGVVIGLLMILTIYLLIR